MANSNEPRKLITIDELSVLWQVPKATIYGWVYQRRLHHVKLGRLLRFDMTEIEKFPERSTIESAGKR
jgi:excisionase family DNA binding protein